MTANNARRRRIVLTGASGYLGQHVLARFLKDLDESYEIFALHGGNGGSHAFEEAVRNKMPDHTTCMVRVEALNLADSNKTQEWVESHAPLNLCLHLAAISSPKFCQDDPKKARAVNVPMAFLEALASHKVPIVALSTDQVYHGDTSALYLESNSVDPVNVYGETKVALEQALETIFAPKQVPYIALRSSIMLGPLAPIHDAAHSTFLHFCASRENQETTFFTDEIRNVLSVQNVVDVLFYFVKNDELKSSGVYNMGGRDRVSRLDMAQAVFRRFGFDPSVLMASKKADQPPSGIASPLDISMDSSKLESLTGIEFWGLEKIIQDTFPDEQRP